MKQCKDRGRRQYIPKVPPTPPCVLGLLPSDMLPPLARGHTNDEVVICNKIKRTSIPSIITFKNCKLSLPRSWRKPSHEGLNQGGCIQSSSLEQTHSHHDYRHKTMCIIVQFCCNTSRSRHQTKTAQLCI